MATVAIHQPNFLPWLGYFDKIIRSDVFVLLDDVQQQKSGGSWTNRVRMIVGGQPGWVTVPIRRPAQRTQAIRDVEIDTTREWRKKMARTIEQSYAGAPAFADVWPLVSELLHTDERFLASYNRRNLHALSDVLGITSERIVASSSLGVAGRGTSLLVELTRAVGGDTYLSGDGADGYLDPAAFSAADIALEYQRFEHPTYPQHIGGWHPGLSLVDALFNVGIAGARHLLVNPPRAVASGASPGS